MSTPVHVLSADTRVLDAMEFMRVKRVRRVPVTRDGRLEGIVTLRDLQALIGLCAESHPRPNATLGDVMTRSVHVVAPDDTLERASEVMLDHSVSGLPVVEKGDLVGVITESDIFLAFHRVMGGTERGDRIVMSIARPADLLDAIRRRLGGMAIRSLAAYPTLDGEMWEAVIRLDLNQPAREEISA
jgi:acetoin utilization protein AcuB